MATTWFTGKVKGKRGFV